MTPEDRLLRRFKRLLDDAVKLAIDRGAKDPQVYFECHEGLLVLDGPSHDDRDHSRQDSVDVDVGWPDVDVDVDMGAW